jgi:hypothetical protein
MIIFGFGLSVAIIYDKRNHYLQQHEHCPTFSKVDKFLAEKQVLSQWHWRYKVRNSGIKSKAELYCPTIQKDSNIFMNGIFVGRSDGKILTTVSKTFIKDCHGKKKFIIRTGNTFETIVNMNKIFVSFELKEYSSTQENEVIAYSEQFNFFTNDIKIKDKNNVDIARMYMNKYQFSAWTWEYSIYNQSHPATDPLVLMIISSKSSFSETAKDKEGNDEYVTDACNSYFWVLSLIYIICLSCVGAFILLGIGRVIYLKYQDYRDNNSLGYRLFRN